MVQSNKANLALRRGRNTLFERSVGKRKKRPRSETKTVENPFARQQLRAQIRREWRAERLGWAMTLLVSLVLFYLFLRQFPWITDVIEDILFGDF